LKKLPLQTLPFLGLNFFLVIYRKSQIKPQKQQQQQQQQKTIVPALIIQGKDQN